MINDLSYRYNGYSINNYDQCKNFVYSLNNNDLSQAYYKRYINKKTNNQTNNQSIKFLGKGGEGVVFLISTNDCGDIVMKIIKHKSNKIINNEQYYAKITRNIIDNNHSPNFLYIYDIIKRDNFDLILSEYADGTLEQCIEYNHLDNDQKWYSLLFQIVQAVKVMQKLNIYHGDMKPKNILFKKIDKNTIFKYDQYKVNTYGYLFIVSDFGHAQSLLMNENKKSIELHIQSNSDLEHIKTIHKRIMVTSIVKKYKLNQLIDIINKNNDIYFDGYYKKEVDKINNELKSYPQSVKDRMILRNVAYYVVEKGYIQPNDLEVRIMPSNKIINMIEQFDNKNIDEILQMIYQQLNPPIEGSHIVTFM